MTLQLQIANGEVVSCVRLVKGKPVKDTDALRKYHREYYHATKQGVECEQCKHTSTSQSANARHQQRNQKCALIRAKKELEALGWSGHAATLSEADV